MNTKYAQDYVTPFKASSLFAATRFYVKTVITMYKTGRLAHAGKYTAEEWVKASVEIGEHIESVGAQIRIEGVENLRKCEGPCVIIANHMSTLETFLLPSIVEPIKDCTFVVKKSLMTFPALGPALASREAIVVGRENPREDLKAVLEGGQAHLSNGRSIILFPQGTRSHDVKAEDFNSLGAKLAAKAGVPLLPCALRTDAWGTGKTIKDFGPIEPSKPVRISFGEAIEVTGNGKEANQRAVQWIVEKYKEFC